MEFLYAKHLEVVSFAVGSGSQDFSGSLKSLLLRSTGSLLGAKATDVMPCVSSPSLGTQMSPEDPKNTIFLLEDPVLEPWSSGNCSWQVPDDFCDFFNWPQLT